MNPSNAYTDYIAFMKWLQQHRPVLYVNYWSAITLDDNNSIQLSLPAKNIAASKAFDQVHGEYFDYLHNEVYAKAS